MSAALNAEEDQQIFIAVCCGVSATALLVYEYLITFDREYQLVWKRRFSLATLIFLLARYPLLLVNILNLPTIYPLSTRSCSVLVWLLTPLQLLFILLSGTLSSLRVYALSGRQWQVASMIFILSLVPFGVKVFTYAQQVVVVAPPPINCTTVYLTSPELTNTLQYVGRVTTITADILVIAVTVHQMYWRRRGATVANLRTSLHTLILRDGTIHFLALLAVNIADIILTYLGETSDDSSYISEFIDPITAIIISRFMLNLREMNAPINSSEDTTLSSSTGSIRLTTFIEPLGAPLDYEFSFSTMDPNYLDDEEADEAIEGENVLHSDEEIMSGQANVCGLPEAESGPSV